MRLTLALVFALLGLGLAQIGEPPRQILRGLSPTAITETDEGFETPGGLAFRLEERGGLLQRLTAEGAMTEANVPVAARLVGLATGYGEGIAQPVREFLANRLGELAGRGLVRLDVEGYALELEVTGEGAPYDVALSVVLPELPADAFPEARHVLGPADARFVVREFSDFQCPFCARYASTTLPGVKDELLARGDVRFEYHHFPLVSIHANAQPAAEASECVADANGAEAFWLYHDGLFERQAAWQDLGDPTGYFVRLAEDLGLSSEGVEACLEERTHADAVRAAYQYAGGVLGLSGTPSVFVNGYKVGNFNDLGSYVRLIELIEAFEGGAD